MSHPRYNQIIKAYLESNNQLIYATDPDTNQAEFFNNKTLKALLHGYFEAKLKPSNLNTFDINWFEKCNQLFDLLLIYKTVPNKSIITKKNVAYPLQKRSKKLKLRNKKLRGKKRYYKNINDKLERISVSERNQ